MLSLRGFVVLNHAKLSAEFSGPVNQKLLLRGRRSEGFGHGGAGKGSAWVVRVIRVGPHLLGMRFLGLGPCKISIHTRSYLM